MLLASASCNTCKRASRPARALGSGLFGEFESLNCSRLGVPIVGSALSWIADSISGNLVLYNHKTSRRGTEANTDSLALFDLFRLFIGAGVWTTTTHAEE